MASVFSTIYNFRLTIPNYTDLDYGAIGEGEKENYIDTTLPNEKVGTQKKVMGAIQFWFRSLVTTDYKSGLTVAFISLPLSIALAIASGATPVMGLCAAMYGPLIQGVLGGSEYNILGPAGALVNILQNLAVSYGTHIIPYVAIVAGVITFLCSITGVAQYCMKIKDED